LGGPRTPLNKGEKTAALTQGGVEDPKISGKIKFGGNNCGNPDPGKISGEKYSRGPNQC